MYKKFLIICCSLLCLAGCEQQQRGTSTVMNKEVPEDFTMSVAAQKNSELRAKTPFLPGKAQVVGVPFSDFPTQTATDTVLPSQVKVIDQQKSELTSP